jgi:putative flippase GtrA
VTTSDLYARGRRYTIVGAVCAVVYNLIMITSAFAGLHYLPASFIAFAFLTPFAYFLHCRFTFRKAPSIDGFLRFTGGAALGYPLSLGLMALFCTIFGLPVLVAAPLTTVTLFIFNYMSAHWAIVRRLRPS